MASSQRPDKSRRRKPAVNKSARPAVRKTTSPPSTPPAGVDDQPPRARNCAISAQPKPQVSIASTAISEWQSTSMPDKWRKHGLIDGQFFYTLPVRLLQTVAAEAGVDS